MSKALALLFHLVLIGLLLSGLLYALPTYAELFFRLDWQREFSGSALMAWHGSLSMVMLMLFGAIVQVHVSKKLKRAVKKYRKVKYRNNLFTGILMLSCMITIVITSLGLYYLGSFQWREWASHVHSLVGTIIVFLGIFHAFIYKSVKERQKQKMAKSKRQQQGLTKEIYTRL